MVPPVRQLMFIVTSNEPPSIGAPSRSKTLEKFMVLSHVQRNRRLRESKKKAEEWTKHASLMTIGGDDSDDADASDAVGITDVLDNFSAHLSTRPRSRTKDPNQVALSQFYPTSNSSDPFHSTVAGSVANIHTLLQQAVEAPAITFLTEAFAPYAVASQRPSMRHSAIVNERLQRCVFDPAVMYSTLAYASGLMATALGVIISGQPPEYFLGLALRAVRQRFANPNHRTDVWSLLCIYCLAVTQHWNCSPELWTRCPRDYVEKLKTPEESHSFKTHITTLVQLVDDAGGWDNFDPYLLESVVLAEKYRFILGNRRPSLMMTWDPGAFPPGMEDHHNESFPRLGTELLRVTVCLELHTVIEDIVNYIRIAYDAWRNESTMNEALESWLYMRFQALVYCLMSLDGLPAGDKCIQLATLTFTHIALENYGAQVCARVVARNLRDSMICLSSQDEPPTSGVRFWCLCTGAMLMEPSAERDWFLAELAAEPNVASLDEEMLRTRLEPYLYVREKQTTQLAKVVSCLKVASAEQY